MPPSHPASEPPLLLGLDVGTSALKALLIDARGDVVADADASYAFDTPRPLRAEQDPQAWWTGAIEAIRALLARVPDAAERIAAVGLAGQMHGLTLVDSRGRTLRPCILWNDQRSEAECASIERELGLEALIRHTGNRVHAGFTLPKLLWVREHEPAVFTDIRHVLLPKDWLRWRLTGEFATDVSDASGTSILDVGARRWSDEIVACAGIDAAWLPAVHESCEVVGAIHRDAAEATGLRAGTPVVAGAGDQAASAIGMGIVDDGQVSVTIGTSGVVFAARDAHRPDTDARLHAFCHAAPGRWHQMGVMLSAGGSLRWFRDVVAPDTVDEARRRGVDAYDVIMERAATAPAGCDGLTFLPYLTGERTPHADAHARGAFVGLTLRHTSAHLARAVLEGITFGLRDSLDLVRATGVEPVLLTLAGGGARGAFWRQLCADVLGRPVVAAGVADAGALGAARLAAVGANLHATIVDACRAMSSAGGANPPGEATARTNPSPSDELAEALERYRSLYPALAPSFRPPPHMVK